MMRITLRLEDKLFPQLVLQIARKRGETLDALLDRTLRSLLKYPSRGQLKLPVSKAGGGTLPGVDLSDSAALLDRMEGR